MNKDKFPLWQKITPTYTPVYSHGEFTLQPMMDGAWRDIKELNLLNRKDEVWDKIDEVCYRSIVMNPPEWLQKRIDNDRRETDMADMDNQ